MRTVAVLFATVIGLLAATLTVAAPAAAAGTAYTWSGDGADSAWTTPDNWVPAGVPGDGDSAVVQEPNDDICHAHVTDVPSGLHLTDLAVDEIPYQGDPDSPCLTSISGGSITIDHTLTFHAGTVDTAITVAAGATATVSPGAVHDTTQFSQSVTVDGAMTLANTAAPELLSLTGGPGITVDPGGTLTTQGTVDVHADCCNNVSHLTNNGTLQVGAGTVTLDAVELDQDGLLNAAGGAQIVTDFAPQSAGPGARWTGTGSWLLGYSSATTVTGTQNLGRGFSWLFGGHGSTAEEFLHGTFTLAGSGRFEWAGGSIGAAMTVGRSTTFVADGPSTSSDPRQLDGRDATNHQIALTNNGAMTFSHGGGWYGVDGASLVNTSTGTLDLGGGTAVDADCCGNPASIVNSGGLVAVPAGAAVPVVVADTGYRATGGTLRVGTGSDLQLTGGAPGSFANTTVTGGGTVEVAQSSALRGTDTIGPKTTFTLEAHGALTAPLSAPVTLGGTGSFAWTGGSVAGALTVATAGGQTLSGTATSKQVVSAAGNKASSLTLAGPTSILAGTTDAPDTLQTDPGSHVTFGRALLLQADTALFGGTITTAGTTTVAASNDSAAVTGNAVLTNAGALTVRTGTLATDQTMLQTGGSTTVAAGATVEIVGSSSVLHVSGGTLTGSGRVQGSVTVGAATVAPGTAGAGTLTVTGAFTSATTATVQVSVGGGTDLLAVGGAATLRGTLRVADVQGYQPVTGSTATVVTAGSLTAQFGCTATTGGPSNQHWTTRVVGGTSLLLTSRAGAPSSC